MMYDVAVTYTANIGPEEADRLTAVVLMETFENLARGVMSMQGRINELKPHEYQDLAHDTTTRDAIKVVLEYFMTHDDYLEFMEMQRVFGNV